MAEQSFKRFSQFFTYDRNLGIGIDVSRMKFPDTFFNELSVPIEKAFEDMASLEKGAIANPDEKRMVGHYWLRDSGMAPNDELKGLIDNTLIAIKDFSHKILSGGLEGEKGKFKTALIVGIGGSALGPQLVYNALDTGAGLKLFFFDNTDPDGMAKILKQIPDLGRNLTVVISKSGGTKETRNGQLVAKNAYAAAGLQFAKHAVAVTGVDSELDTVAKNEGWLKRFPMWDWIGGRTSELCAVGLLPALLHGADIDEMLLGAKQMDIWTRTKDPKNNPAMLMALMWHYIGGGKGAKDLVVLPYLDRLELMSRYLQQLIMESIGKEKDLAGKTVNQGIAVYGNKGSTDQHAYVQQLRDGVNNFFATFIVALSTSATDNNSPFSLEVEPDIRCCDYLHGFFQGTRKALYENGRESISIIMDLFDARRLGMLIALFERSVGFYASLVNVNAYHQPGVEAGKKAASDVITLQHRVLKTLKANSNFATLDEICGAILPTPDTESVFLVLRSLAATKRVIVEAGEKITQDAYRIATL